MTAVQERAYMELDYGIWKSAYGVRGSISTLNALVRKGEMMTHQEHFLIRE